MLIQSILAWWDAYRQGWVDAYKRRLGVLSADASPQGER